MILKGYKNGTVNYAMMPVILGLLVFVMNEIGIRYYFSFIRRVKAKKVLRTTLIYNIYKRIL